MFENEGRAAKAGAVGLAVPVLGVLVCLGVFLSIFCRHAPGLVTSFAKLFFAPLPKRV